MGRTTVLLAPNIVGTPYGRIGRMDYLAMPGGHFCELRVANKVLSDQVKLTSGSADSGWAVWKPGGAKLAFESDRTDPDLDDTNAINDIFTMNPDDTVRHSISSNPEEMHRPDWESLS
jgi:hypothetical protein